MYVLFCLANPFCL